jgi:hypothetical protein
VLAYSIYWIRLTHVQNKRQEEAVKIKRERQKDRENSEETMVGDDELEWVGTRPAERCTKRIRHCPGIGDEVVSLDD